MISGSRTLLAADIGGTNARFAAGRVEEDGTVRLSAARSYKGAEFASAEDVLRAWLAETGMRPDAAAFAAAGPVRGGAVTLTNRDWTFSEDSIRAASGARTAHLLNDFAANALSLPYLRDDAFVLLDGPPPPPDLWARPDLRVSALGPGTGLGHAVLLRARGVVQALDTEGGHVSFAAWDEETWAVVRAVSARFGRCSLENLASGPGLVTLHAARTGDWDHGLSPRQIEARARTEGGEAARTVALFCRILGAGAGDLALAVGARCVFIFGGVAGAMADELRAGGFRERFEAKGRFADYMRAIPTVLAQSPHAGLIGAAAALKPGASKIVIEEG